MIECFTTEDDDLTRLACTGNLTLAEAEQLAGELKSLLDVQDLVVDFVSLDAFDLAGLQVLYALCSSRRRRKLPVRFAGEAALERIAKMTIFAGLPMLPTASEPD